jgi:hypothetical protein
MSTKQKAPRHLKAKYPYKEQWLHEALERFIRPHFSDAGYTVPEHVRISTGWPSRGALARKKRTVGQAWSTESSGDGVHETIISLYLDDPIKVLGVLIHEVCHHVVGVDQGHGKAFVDCMEAVGLCGKPTSTQESDWLVSKLGAWKQALGPYPHAKLNSDSTEKQSTRLLKMECDCGCKVRVTAKWIDEYGRHWDCPCGGTLELTGA